MEKRSTVVKDSKSIQGWEDTGSSFKRTTCRPCGDGNTASCLYRRQPPGCGIALWFSRNSFGASWSQRTQDHSVGLLTTLSETTIASTFLNISPKLLGPEGIANEC